MDTEQTAVPSKSLPPYGPAKGMIQGLELLQRSNPARVDEALLRVHGIAPHNEYKVVGALRYLGVIDEHGVPTAKSRLLKTRGAAFKLHLQDIIRTAYADLFASIPAGEATREKIYNYFVTEVGLAGEMATKASRFFIEICRLAEINLGPATKPSRNSGGPRESGDWKPLPSTGATCRGIRSAREGFPLALRHNAGAGGHGGRGALSVVQQAE